MAIITVNCADGDLSNVLLSRQGGAETFTQLRVGAQTDSDSRVEEIRVGDLGGGSDHILSRRFITFDTSVLGNVTLVGATLSAYCDVAQNALSLSISDRSWALVQGTSDYATFGSDRFADTDQLPASSTWLTWTLNAAGIAAINKSGTTIIGVRLAVDVDAGSVSFGAAGYWTGGRIIGYSGSNPSYLTVTYNKSNFMPFLRRK